MIHIALFRGINVSGKNKIDMKLLKMGFEELGFTNIKTVLNSGNVIFDAENEKNLREKISRMIEKKFSLDIPVLVIKQDELKDILSHKPDWWGTEDKAIYDNLIFVFPEFSTEDVMHKLGELVPEIEKAASYRNTIFWSFELKFYRKSKWYSNSAKVPVKDMITVRTCGTAGKLV